MNTTSTYRIYVASLSDYNNGNLHGSWIDLDGKDADDIQEEINAILRTSKYPNITVEHEGKEVHSAEEWAIHDYELDGIKISETPDLDDLVTLVELLEEHGEAFKVAYENFGDVDQAKDAVEDNYQGCFRALEDWAEDLADQTGMLHNVPENLRNYFDWERYAKDCEMSGDIWTAESSEGIHVFWNH